MRRGGEVRNHCAWRGAGRQGSIRVIGSNGGAKNSGEAHFANNKQNHTVEADYLGEFEH